MYVYQPPAMFFENPYRRAIPGQWIKSWSGVVWHHGIVSGFWLDARTNKWHIMVTHTTVHHGKVVETTLHEFCGDRAVEIVRQPGSAQEILATAKANLNVPYLVFSQNCEHFASFCYTHKAESRQLQEWAVALSLVAAAVMVANTNSRPSVKWRR